MRLIIDTHTLLWATEDPAKLSVAAQAAITEAANERLLSAATIWELAIKVGQGKITLSMPYRPWMEKAITDLKLAILPVTVAYSERQSIPPPHHKDPFDRMMIAQALTDNLTIVSIDTQFDAYGVQRLW